MRKLLWISGIYDHVPKGAVVEAAVAVAGIDHPFHTVVRHSKPKLLPAGFVPLNVHLQEDKVGNLPGQRRDDPRPQTLFRLLLLLMRVVKTATS